MSRSQVNYTGIGSRRAPKYILETITDISTYLGSTTDVIYNLRSGGANGPDTAFELGVVYPGTMEIFLPWKGFNGNESNLYNIPEKAFEIAAMHHPAWGKLKPSVKRLMARNAQQVLGQNLDSPSDFVLCWTPDGCERAIDRTHNTGGTGLAIAVADTYGIPVYNIKNYENRINTLLDYIVAYGNV